MIGIFPPLEWLSELAANVHEEAPSSPDRNAETGEEAAGKAESERGTAGPEQRRD